MICVEIVLNKLYGLAMVIVLSSCSTPPKVYYPELSDSDVYPHVVNKCEDRSYGLCIRGNVGND